MKKTKKIKINLNGKPLSLPIGTTVYKVVKKIKAQPSKVAIELNGKILPQNQYNSKKLNHNDKIRYNNYSSV